MSVLLAGTVELETAVSRLQAQRPVFHSEADLQHAFAWAVHELDPGLRVRLETRPKPNHHLDLLFSAPTVGRHTAVELKYLTAGWHGEVAGEQFALKNHGAQDVRAYDVVKDLERVEHLIAERPDWNGLVLVLTNDPSYWSNPIYTRETNAQAFRIYHGNVLQGVRAWGVRAGAGTKAGRNVPLTLSGTYLCNWRDYAMLQGPRGAFRLLHFAVPAGD